MSLVKIDKRTANKEYDKGATIHLLPSKVAPESMWIHPMGINKISGRKFETLINEYAYYNCTQETGLRVTYYIDK